MQMKFILGGDPGMTGALALLDQHGNLIATADITSTEGRVNVQAVRDTLLDWREEYCVHMGVVENVASMPKQGVSTTFKFGRAAGHLEGVIQALFIPVSLITPAQWKTRLKMTGKDKDYPRQWCKQRWPTVTDFNAKGTGQARADAACLALAWLEMHPEFREGEQKPPPSKRPPPRRSIVP